MNETFSMDQAIAMTVLSEATEKCNQYRIALRRIINLSRHPLFPEVTELPAWEDAINIADALTRS